MILGISGHSKIPFSASAAATARVGLAGCTARAAATARAGLAGCTARATAAERGGLRYRTVRALRTPLTAILLSATLLACATEPAPPPEPPRAIEIQLTDTEFEERDADISPDGLWVVYGSSQSGDEDLYKMPAVAGGTPIQLTSGPSEDLYAEWSPDGTRILFTSNRGGGTDNVWTMAADGSDIRQVTQSSDQVANRRGHLADWSFDGTRIAFESTRGGDEISLWSMPAEGGTATRLTDGKQGGEQFPAWSPDGRQIAFARVEGRAADEDLSDIFVRDLDTGVERRLAPHPGNDWAPDWSPDGRWLVFSSWRGGNIELWVVAADGSGAPINVTSTPERQELVPRWGPDSRRLAFNAIPQGDTKLLMDRDGGSRRVLDIDHSVIWGASDDELVFFDDDRRPWRLSLSTGDSSRVSDAPVGVRFFFSSARTSPDGRFLVYVAEPFSGDEQLFLQPLDGGRSRQVTASPMRMRRSPRWSPDSRTLAFTGVDSDGRVDIYTVPANGGTETRLTESRGESFLPTWSPDGEQIAFVRADSSGYRIHIMPAGGGPARFLVEGDDPLWSPDGEYILYAPGAWLGTQDLYRIRPEGGEPELVYDGSGQTGGQWSPSGDLILVTTRVAGNLFIRDVGPLLDAYGSPPQ